jgi:hypothetical protein
MTALRVLQQADCSTFPCREECCSVGVDVWPEERQRMIDDGVAGESDFTGPEDDDGDLLYRTALGPRGCVFLLPTRGCRLHDTGYKPEVCTEVPRDAEEVAELAGYGMLPCHEQWKWKEE